MVIFHKDRASAFIRQIMGAYSSETHLFGHIHHGRNHAPQRRFIPRGIKEGSLLHRRYLFGTTLGDYMSDSADVFATSVHLWEQHPNLWGTAGDIFGPGILDMSVEEVVVALQRARSTFHKTKARRWHGSFTTLYRELDGDPRNIFTLGNSIEEVVAHARQYERVHKRKFLPGYGPKILSLLALHFYDFGIHADMFPGAFPVDRHIQRQLLGCGVVEFAVDVTEVDAARAIAEVVRPQLVALCEELGVSVFELAHAMWFLGNKLCYQCRSLMERKRESKLAFCPIRSMCEGARETRTYQERGKWRVSTATEPDDSPQGDLFD